MSSARAEFADHPSSVGDARRFLRHELHRWSADELEPAASLVLSELATNSILHARSGFAVELSFTGRELRIAVLDHSTRVPAMKPYGPEAATGRGLRLVTAFVDAWGTEPRAGGKTVWAVLSTAQLGPSQRRAPAHCGHAP